MANNRFVAYYRVSTAKQGRSGLGLDGQQAAVRTYLNGGAWTLLEEFTEIESGKVDTRPQLARALALCNLTGATLVIAKLDRLSRDAAFLLGLEKAGVDFVAADMPSANRLTVRLVAVIAQEEREMISARTKAALAQSKKKLGGYRGGPVPDAQAGGKAVSEAADAFASRVAPMMQEMRGAGLSLAAIASTLEATGIRTPRGGAWTATAVRRALARA